MDAVSSFLSVEQTIHMNRFIAYLRSKPVRLWLTVAAFAVSFGYGLFYQITPSVDARKFHATAVNIVTRHSFCSECNVPLAQDTAIRDIGPGYQFFLAAVYTIFGIHTWIVWLLQALMHATVVWWLYGLIRRVLGSVASNHLNTTLPLALYAFHPDIIQATAMLMSEIVFVFILVGIVKLFVLIWEHNGRASWGKLVWMGALLGALMMVRPTGAPVLVVVLFVFVWKRWWKALILVLISAVLIQAPWAIRNARLYHSFVLNSVVGGLDIWAGLDPHGSGEFNLSALPNIRQKIAGLDPDQIDRVSLEEVKKIVLTKPLFAIGRTVQKGLKLFALSKTSAFWFHYKGAWDRLFVLIGSVLFNLALLGMFCASLWDALVHRRFHHWILALGTVLVILLAIPPTLTVVVNRYRIPMLPFMALASAGWLAFVTEKDRRNSLIAAMLMLVLTTSVDVWGSLDKVKDRLLRFH